MEMSGSEKYLKVLIKLCEKIIFQVTNACIIFLFYFLIRFRIGLYNKY